MDSSPTLGKGFLHCRQIDKMTLMVQLCNSMILWMIRRRAQDMRFKKTWRLKRRNVSFGKCHCSVIGNVFCMQKVSAPILGNLQVCWEKVPAWNRGRLLPVSVQTILSNVIWIGSFLWGESGDDIQKDEEDVLKRIKELKCDSAGEPLKISI